MAPERGRGDRGAALMEFALVMPVLFLLLFGIIEFGFAFNDYQAVRQGVREGARQAVVADYGSTTACSQNGAAAGLATAGADGNTRKVMCTVKDNVDSDDDTLVRVKVVFTDNNGTTDFSTDRVKVCAVKLLDPITGFLDPLIEDKPMRAETEMRAEKNLTLSSSQETDPSGDNWSWC
jgi:Flp pilus assembly protein TadG